MAAAWILLMGFLEYTVLAVLVGLSIWSVAIVIDRRRFFKARLAGKDFKQAVQELEAGRAPQGAGVFSDLYAELEKKPAAVADRVTKRFVTEERLQLERGLTVLATLGSNAPFIGLFGTVLGIMAAFAALSGGSSGSGAGTEVMSGIARALIATAAGLFVAIPAVVAFNTFSRRSKEILQQCEAFKEAWLMRGESRGR